MLKLLLGHWKAHRKKPSLLPQDGDIHFEDPSKINPIFEDSDSSTSSTQRRTDSRSEEHQTATRLENEQNASANNVPVTNELIDVSVPTHSKDSVPSDITLPKDEITDTEGSKSSLITETISESGNLEKSESSCSLQQDVGDINLSSLEPKDENVKELESSPESVTTNVSSKVDTESLEIKSEDKMRLYNQPSTSAIRGSKNSLDNTTHEKESTQFHTPKASAIETNKQKVSKENYPQTLKNIESSSEQIKVSSPTSVESSEPEKPANLRAKAIAELIKKFQGPIAESENAANNVTKPDKKPLSNQPPKVEEISNTNQNNKDKNPPSSFQNFHKEGHKLVMPQTEDIPKTAKSTTENVIKKPINSTTETVIKKPIHSTTETVIPKSTTSTTETVIPKTAKSTAETIIPKSTTSTTETVIPKTAKSTAETIIPKTAKSTAETIIPKSTTSTTEAVIPKTTMSTTETVIQKTTRSTTETVIPKPTNAATKAVIPSKNDEGIEALSNIFKFPPPPPLENQPNESSLHGKIMKEWKFNSPLATSSKSKENTDNLKNNESGKTRLDSSLERTRTASSNKLKEKPEMDNNKETTNKIQDAFSKESAQEASARIESPVKGFFLGRRAKESKKSNKTTTEQKTNETKASSSKIENTEERLEPKKIESEPQASNSVPTKKQSTASDPKSEIASKISHKDHHSSNAEATPKSPVHKQKSSISKASAKPYSPNENENMKSHSEDSGITRGDQISSETTHETPIDNPPEEVGPAPNPSRKNKKDKKLKSIHKKICKNCKHAHGDGAPIRRSQYDEYYDGLTSARHSHRGRHSDSWTSDISWEERELLRRLRGRRGTVRSNTPSTRSRLSKHRYTDQNLFRRHHNLRRSYSDDSTFYGSMCSCEECWAQYVKGYAYGRASLRGVPPVLEMCTCRTSRPNFLGRRVKFRSDTIHEVSPSERTTRTSTPAPPAEGKQEGEDEADDKSSQMSSKTKDGDSVHTNPNGIKSKKSKTVGEAYRFVTPWELEEWDIIMRKQLLQSRRKRARCMGIMALAMVIFIGLVVTILMVYLRRKTL